MALMFVANRVFDVKKFWSGYARQSIALVAKFGGKYRVMVGESEVLEGEPDCEGAAVIVVEWPDMATGRAFWNSPEYREIKKLRAGISHARVWLTDGKWMEPEEGEAIIADLLRTLG
jgi:uncharacterized protein (DUF1330 family)